MGKFCDNLRKISEQNLSKTYKKIQKTDSEHV